MNKKRFRRNVFCLTVLLLFLVCVTTGCNEKKVHSDAGCYKLFTMDAGTDSYDHETIVKYGLDSMTLILYDDGTASLAYGNEVPRQMQWRTGVITDQGQEVSYTVQDDRLTLVHSDETLVFEKVGNPPKKAEIQTPGNAIENSNKN